MPFFFDRSGEGTSINIDTDVPKRSNTTFTAARKFSLPEDTNQENRGVTIKSNDEHFIEQAASMKGVAVAAESIAASAVLNLQAAREQLSSVQAESNRDFRSPMSSVTEFDVHTLAEVRSQNLASSLQLSIPMLDTKAIADDFHKNIAQTVFRIKNDIPAPVAFNSVVPQLSSITVDMAKNRGTVDCFFSHLRFHLPLSEVWNGKIKAIRIFRSTLINPIFKRAVSPVISMRGLERLSTMKNRTRVKGADQLSSIEHRYREAGVLTSLSILNPIDPETNRRLSTNSSDTFTDPSRNPSSVATITGRSLPNVASFLDPERYGHLDSSVANDLNVIRNIQNQDPASSVVNMPQMLTLNTAMASRQGLLHPSQVTNLRLGGTSPIVVSHNNSQEFRELAVISLDKLKSNVIGDTVEYEFIDESVGYGKGYRYYVNSIDRDMVESVRSQIVDITIEGLRIPERPKRVFSYNVSGGVSLNIIVDDQLVEKFEVFRREDVLAFAKQLRRYSLNVSDMNGFNTNSSIVNIGQNGFIKIGEGMNTSKGQGASFFDREVRPGLKYLYRIYSVDIFGNKSESPYEVSIYVPSPSAKPNELTKPTLTAEVDAKTNKAKLTFKCTDTRVKNLFLARRDLTIGQKAFTAPGQVNFIKFGSPKAGEGARHFEDVLLRGENKDTSWTGMFENNQDGVVYTDTTVHQDHIYQYSIYGVDLYGNSTPHDICKPFMIVNRAMISTPVNLEAEVVQGPNFSVGGVRLTWQEGNVDVPSEDVIGNQSSLSDSNVRTLYQIERKKVGEERWIEFPLVSELRFFDPSKSSLGLQKPEFRPELVETNQTYIYRVKAMQTGSFVSNYSDFVEIFAALQISPPSNFRVRSADAKVSPFYVVLNWDTDNQSGVVDKWEIERAEINNFAGARLNIKNPADFQKLSFKSHREVFRESSRALSHGLDRFISKGTAITSIRGQTNGPPVTPTIFTGQHQFQDNEVRFGNTYFYRIRAVGVDGAKSSWVYKGMKLTEDHTEKLIAQLITPAVQLSLSETFTPLVIQGPWANSLSSFSLQPAFSSPKLLPQVTVSAPPPLQVTIKQPTPVPTFSLATATVKPIMAPASVARAQLLNPTLRSSLLFRGF